MSYLKPGTRCVIVDGCNESIIDCPKNVGVIVEILACYPPCPPRRTDSYKIRTVSGRPFPQIWNKNLPINSSNSNECFTDRHRLCPLDDLEEESEVREADVEDVRNRKQELADCSS
jgi:hypothetical protein